MRVHQRQPEFRALLPIVAAAVALLTYTARGSAQSPATPLFPRPFVVEHAVSGRGAGGADMRTPTVTDYYGGSWIISVRTDTSRMVVDFDRREITEIKPKDSTYSVATFDRFADLRRRLHDAQQPPPPPAGSASASAGPANPAPGAPSFTFEELPVQAGSEPAPAAAGSGARVLAARAGVRHLRLSRGGGTAVKAGSGSSATSPWLEVWLDPTVTLTAPALAALSRFNGEVLSGGSASSGPLFSAMLTAAREKTGGAFPIRTLHPVPTTASGTAGSSIEDLVTRLEYVEKFPADLLKVPAGYRRVAHPLEAMVAYLEEEARRDQAAKNASTK